MRNTNLILKKVGSKYYLEIFGKLNEDTSFSNVDLSAATEFIVNFKEVSQIQSCGVREWITLIKGYSHLPFTFVNCPKVIIDQINMVGGFLPNNGKVDSFFVPYCNDLIGNTMNVLFRFGVDYDQNGNIRFPRVIDAEANLMELDVVEHKYFRFLKQERNIVTFVNNKLNPLLFTRPA